MDEYLTEADLPMKYTAVSTCFRREAGTYGKDTAGLYRVHQFDKCEQVVICRNDVEESKRWHREMLGYSEELLKRLKLPYRVIQCCTGDIGVKNASMMDIETWMPSREQPGKPETGYGETHTRQPPLRIPGAAAEPALQGQGRQDPLLPHAEQHGRRQPAHPDPDPGELPERRRQRDDPGRVAPYMGGRERIG